MIGNVEDFEKVFNKENPNYEKDLDKLMWRYMDNKEKEIKKEKLRARLKKAETLSIIGKTVLSNNWVVDMKLTPSKSKEEHYEKQIKTILGMFDEIGLLEDFFEYFGSDEKAANEIKNLIDRLIEDQTKRKKKRHIGILKGIWN